MNKLKNLFWIIVGIAIVGYFIYKIGRNTVADHIPPNKAIKTKAVIIDERNYIGNQKVKPEFSYSYLFMVNDEKYQGNAHDITLKVGDTIEVEYHKDHPDINKPLNPKY